MNNIILTLLLVPILGLTEEFNINATVDINELNDCISIIKSHDVLPILSVSQDKKKSTVKLMNENGAMEDVEIDVNDPETLRIRTGKSSGPLSGGGNIHILRRIDGKWKLIKTSHWVS